MQKLGNFAFIFAVFAAAIVLVQFSSTPSKTSTVGATADTEDVVIPLEQDRHGNVSAVTKKKKAKNPNRFLDWSKSSRWLTVNRRNLTAPGLTLVPTSGSAEVALIDMQGRTLNKWNVDAARARLMPNGNILVVHGSAWGERVRKWRNLMPYVVEYDWNGNEVWRYKTRTIAHHDLQRLENGNTLYLSHHDVPPHILDQVTDPLRKEKGVLADIIVEVTPEGERVWEWKIYDHYSVNYCGPRPCLTENERGKLKAIRDWTHTNTLTVIPENKWFDGGDERFRPGNVMILPRRFWTPIIIDRQTGKPVWKYTGEGYNGGFGAPHEASMIPKGLPGAGNVILVDNGMGTHPGETYIVEVNPVTMEVVWVYDKGTDFFNRTRGSVQRLANGNTLISYDRDGSVLEVNPAGETVWEFRVKTELTRARRYDFGYCKRCDEAAQSVSSASQS